MGAGVRGWMDGVGFRGVVLKRFGAEEEEEDVRTYDFGRELEMVGGAFGGMVTRLE